MRPALALLLLVAAACTAPQPMTSAAMEPEPPQSPGTLAVLERVVELGDRPTTVVLPLANNGARALEVARDPRRALVLRVEGIAVTAPPGIVWEVLIGASPQASGVLALYAAEEARGSFVAAVPVDEAAVQALGANARELRVTFRPRGITDASGREIIDLQGRPRFSRLRLVEE